MEENQDRLGQIQSSDVFLLKYKSELGLKFMTARKHASYIFKFLSLPMIYFNKSFILSKKWCD